MIKPLTTRFREFFQPGVQVRMTGEGYPPEGTTYIVLSVHRAGTRKVEAQLQALGELHPRPFILPEGRALDEISEGRFQMVHSGARRTCYEFTRAQTETAGSPAGDHAGDRAASLPASSSCQRA